MNDIKSSVYAQKVELLLRLIPIVMDEGVFAIHGGTAINLFMKDLPRYSHNNLQVLKFGTICIPLNAFLAFSAIDFKCKLMSSKLV